MKTAIGGTQLFMIVIVLLLLFTGYMCMSINYTAAYKVADAVIVQLQKDEGFNAANVGNVLRETKYTNGGKCYDDFHGFKLNGEPATNDANYCIRKVKVADGTEELPAIYYYQIQVFFNVDVPFFSAINFNVKGDSANIYSPTDVHSGGKL